jgi:hypothetical protein
VIDVEEMNRLRCWTGPLIQRLLIEQADAQIAATSGQSLQDKLRRDAYRAAKRAAVECPSSTLDMMAQEWNAQ